MGCHSCRGIGRMKINKVIIVINRTKSHAAQTANALKTFLEREKVQQEWIETLPPQKNLHRKMPVLRDRPRGSGHRGRRRWNPAAGRTSVSRFRRSHFGHQHRLPRLHHVHSQRRVRQEMKRVLNAEFIISQRTALDLAISSGRKRVTGWALNDALITRGGNPHLIGIEARIGQRRLTSYRCDGLIIATPTGSTAYSLAAGGPIISPECNVLTVTPICPQALTNRSVVVNSTEPIELQLDSSSGPAEVQVDGMRLAQLSPASVITVKTSDDSVPIAFLPEINYYDVLAEKLKWRGDGLAKPKYGHA